MQNSDSSRNNTLKAGNTKAKMTLGSGATSGNLSKKNRNRPFNESKTSQSDKDNDFVVVDGKVRTPKRIITNRYKDITDEYMKLTEADEERDRREKENQVESRNRHSLNSAKTMQSDSEVRNSGSNIQDRSEVLSSEKSENESEAERDRAIQKKQKKNQELTMEDLEQNVTVSLCETPTMFTLFIPSACHALDNKAKEEANAKYVDYVKEINGSDNYVNRPVQTFNHLHKQTLQSVEKLYRVDIPDSVETGVFTANWDIIDTNKQEQKTYYYNLQEDIRKQIYKYMNSFMTNPFATLSLDEKAIDIHSRYEIPGAAYYVIKEKDKTKDNRTRTVNQTVTNAAGARYESKTGTNLVRYNSTKNNRDTSGAKTRQQKANQLQMYIRQEQQKVEEEYVNHLRGILSRARNLPSEHERKILANEHLVNALKYVDRILNTQNFYKYYILYRNYPEVKFKKFTEDEQKPKARRAAQYKKQESSKSALQLLFKFSCKNTEGYSVTSADWNPINKDLLAVSYGDLDIDSTRYGYLMFWTLKNPSFPEKIIVCPTRITTCKFSNDNPNLIACGTYDGVVAIYDIRKKDSKPVAYNREVLDKHSDAVWEIQWISKGKGDKGESLVSISADGRITEWSMKKGLEFTDLMLLRRIPQTNKKDTSENMNFRFASGLSFEFLKNEASMYLATTEEGIIYRCSKSYTQQFLELYYGHSGPVYRVRCNPFFSDIFLTCSADWSCKLWNWRRDQALNTFQSLDLNDYVSDIEWSPNCSTLFASVCKDGRLYLWDLSKKNMLDPILILGGPDDQKYPPKTMVRFSKGAPVLVTGDVTGDVYVYRLNIEYENLDEYQQAERLMKLLYPNGYNRNNSRDEPGQAS